MLDKADISTHIGDSLNYDKVIVKFRRDYVQSTFERLFKDVILFIPENYNNIHAFFQKHYPECYPDLSRNVSVHQDKKQRSVSPPPSPSFFPGNASHQRDESDLPLTAEMLVRYLQQDPRVWKGVTRSPEVLNETCGQIKRLRDDSTLNPKTVSPQK